MKKIIALIFTVAGLTCANAQIVLWDFNSPEEDSDPATGTLEPAIGVGTCALVGTVTSDFAMTEPGSSDFSSDNSGLRTAGYPPQGTGNKTSGVEFRFSTAGYENIHVTWDQRNGLNSSRFWRVQYTIDGNTWVDYTVVTNAVADTWRHGYGQADFQPIPAAANNPNFGFRVVSEFQSTAFGHGSRGYTITGTASGSYSAGSQVWFDMVSVQGTPLDTENPYPTISSIPNQTVRNATPEIFPNLEIPFTVNDSKWGAESVWTEVRFSNPNVADVDVSGSGTDRVLTIYPKTQAVTGITVWVVVHGATGKQNSSAFTLDIFDPDHVPTPLPFTLADFEAEAFIDRANGSALFRLPTFSGDRFAVATSPSVTQVKDIGSIPSEVASNPDIGERIIHVNWAFTEGEGVGYVRLRTLPNNTSFLLPNPIISFEHPFSFDIYSDQPMQICLLLRETNSEGELGTDGGTSGSVKWIGGANPFNGNLSVSEGFPVPANQWMTVVFDIPALGPSAVPRTGSGPLFSTTGKGTLEALGLIGERGLTYNIYMDNFKILPASAPPVLLEIAFVEDAVEISWPADASGTLHRTATLNPVQWEAVSASPATVGDRKVLTISVPQSQEYFRLAD